MHPDMLHLAERLVTAIETMSQDVKNMSAYIYDISCSVSYLLKEKREKECISISACDKNDITPNVTSAAGQEASAERVYSGQYEQADESSSSHIADPEDREGSFGYIAPMSIAPHETSGVLPPEGNPIFNAGIKIEVLPEIEENDDSSYADNMSGDCGSDNRISNEMKSETQWATEGEDQTYDLHTTISPSMGQLTPSGLLESPEPASAHVRQEIQLNSSLKNAGSAFVSRLPGVEISVARTQHMESAEETSVVNTRGPCEGESYKCSFCGKLFSALSHLQNHMQIHTRERPFKCNLCEKAFTQNCHLTQHMRSHTGERPYGCTICGKAFSEKAILKHHMRTHTGERPYRCVVCGNAFRQNCHLTAHMRIHTDEKPFSCTLCGKAFRYTYSLNEHMRTHARVHPN